MTKISIRTNIVTGLAALVLGLTVGTTVLADRAPVNVAPASAPSPTATVTETGDQPLTQAEMDALRPEELIVWGAGLTYMIMDECPRGHDVCEAALKEANANPFGVIFMEDGSAITRPEWDALKRSEREGEDN